MIGNDRMLRFRIYCDGCQKAMALPGVYVADSHTALRNDAAKFGWSVAGSVWYRQDLCPACTAERTLGDDEG